MTNTRKSGKQRQPDPSNPVCKTCGDTIPDIAARHKDPYCSNVCCRKDLDVPFLMDREGEGVFAKRNSKHPPLFKRELDAQASKRRRERDAKRKREARAGGAPN